MLKTQVVVFNVKDSIFENGIEIVQLLTSDHTLIHRCQLSTSYQHIIIISSASYQHEYLININISSTSHQHLINILSTSYQHVINILSTSHQHLINILSLY
ncbi:hypothetical protein BgiBS90_021062 [Biomphalaria glabrata]|nr:hypothetical protein BgiBS90_021062 [Biomphalaria glabrata]